MSSSRGNGGGREGSWGETSAPNHDQLLAEWNFILTLPLDKQGDAFIAYQNRWAEMHRLEADWLRDSKLVTYFLHQSIRLFPNLIDFTPFPFC